MVDAERARKAACTVITQCLALPPESEIAVVADETTLRIATLLVDEAVAQTHRTNLIYFHTGLQERLREKGLAESVRNALKHVAATILCVSGSARSLFFREEIRRTAWGHGRKVAHMPGVNWRTLLAADADYAQLSERCEGLALALVKSREIQITTTDQSGGAHTLSAALTPWRRLPIISDGIIYEGSWGNVPSGETYIAPLEASGNGEIVINGSLPGLPLARGQELVLGFESGRLTRVLPEDSPAARHLFETQIQHARDKGDANWNNLAEIGLGVNERIHRLTGVPLLDEKKYGSAHIALGDNTDMGGQVESLVHCDLVCLRPEIRVDGKPIVSGGKIVLRESDWREDYRTVQLADTWNPHSWVSPTVSDARVDGRGQLKRLWDTSSGRVCAVPVGSEETAVKAALIWRQVKENSEAVPANALWHKFDDLDERDFRHLLQLLEKYGLVQIS